MDEQPKRPGGALATRPLHFIWMCDCSGSMSVNGKIQALNNAIRDVIPLMRNVASDNPNAQVLVRCIKFSDQAEWHVADPTPVAQFNWADLQAEGTTAMGAALSLLAQQLKIPPMTDRALPPVLVLISDGQPTDDFDKGLNDLMGLPWGQKAVRTAIAIGDDADQEVLSKFIGNPDLKPLLANNPEALVRNIRWVSTAVLKSASQPSTPAAAGATVIVPTQPPSGKVADDIW
jgi:uncharacterized protein YegL